MDTLFLQTGGTSLNVKLHPVVLFSIVDHYVRRAEGQTRVIGTLLGTVHQGTIEVRNCFPVPHAEKSDETVAVSYQYNKNMLALHKRVNAKEEIVGWYATSVGGEAITEFNCLIHDFYAAECANPLHLVVDASMTMPRLTVKAFVCSPLSFLDKALVQFQQVVVSMEASEAERIGISSMLTGGKVPEARTTSLASDMAGLEASMHKLASMIAIVRAYVAKVVAPGAKEGDEEIGRKISDAVAAVPHIEPAAFERIFNDSLQDMLMVAYLSQLLRVQLAIAEKLAMPPPARGGAAGGAGAAQ